MLAVVTVAVVVLAAAFNVYFWILGLRGWFAWRRLLRERPEPPLWPRAHVLVPLKGALPRIRETLAALDTQDYAGEYRVTFVTEATAADGDEAAALLEPLLAELPRFDHVIAGRVIEMGRQCCQKNWNLLEGMKAAKSTVGAPEVWAFCDGDLVLSPTWLTEITRPVVTGAAEASTSFHYLTPTGRKILHALHGLAETAQSLAALVVKGATWGGSMAIRSSAFERAGLERFWSRTVVDDMSASRVLKKAHLRVAAVPRFLVHGRSEIESWHGFVRWLGRQYFFVKVYLPRQFTVLWLKNTFDVALFTLASFHLIYRVWAGSWAAGPVVGGLVVAGAAAFLIGFQICRYLLPERPPVHSWVGASMLAPGISLLACADATLRRRRLRWRDLTYLVDRDGAVSKVIDTSAPTVATEAAPKRAA